MEPVLNAYKNLIVDMQFERSEILEVIRQHYSGDMLLYTGCSIHITPSFYFPHVTYVDKGSHAESFFAHHTDVMNIINGRKMYKRSAYIQFIAQDYTEALPLLDAEYDFLFALYAGGIAESCKRYLKSGGILLSNDHLDDGGIAARDADFELVGVINGDKLSTENLGMYFIPKPPITNKAHIRYSSPIPSYTRKAEYYVFRKK